MQYQKYIQMSHLNPNRQVMMGIMGPIGSQWTEIKANTVALWNIFRCSICNKTDDE